jgi:hypothetical protein
MLRPGTAFLIPTPPNKEHLFIIIAINKESTEALLVNITSPKIGCDQSCCVNLGEHPFLKHDSVVNYRDARLSPLSNLEHCIKKEIFRRVVPVSNALLKRIQDGGLISNEIPLKCQDFLCSNT